MSVFRVALSGDFKKSPCMDIKELLVNFTVCFKSLFVDGYYIVK